MWFQILDLIHVIMVMPMMKLDNAENTRNAVVSTGLQPLSLTKRKDILVMLKAAEKKKKFSLAALSFLKDMKWKKWLGGQIVLSIHVSLKICKDLQVYKVGIFDIVFRKETEKTIL